jgi:predicted ATPase
MGTELPVPYTLTLLAEAYGQGEQRDEGLPLLAEALAVADTTAEHWYEAELYRLKGELLHKSAAPQGAVEQSLQHALAIARHQQAKSWELRAAVSLGRLWRQQGKRAEAHALLAPLYGWFTEGFDTPELQEAKLLLEELS